MSNQTTTNAEAIEHSQNCFLNSLLREWQDFSIHGNSEIHLRFVDGVVFVLPLKRFSKLGRHQFASMFFVEINQQTRSLRFNELVQELSAALQKQFTIGSAQVEAFQNRVANSIKVIDLALNKRRNTPETLPWQLRDFRFYEQNLLVGHCFHPTPKSREEFSENDLQLFSPELAGQFPLIWVAADRSVVHRHTSLHFRDKAWTKTLLRHDNPTLLKNLPDTHTPIPMHPWQWQQIQKNPRLQNYFASKQLIVLGPSQHDWYPTSSLRTVYQPQAPYMLKFSMSVRLTNSVRHLLPKEVDRGIQLADVMHTPVIVDFKKRYPQFQMILEPSYICLQDSEGQMIPETLLVCRENPFTDGNQINKAVLATLTQDTLTGEDAWLAVRSEADARAWFAAFLQHVVEPILIAQADYGVVLGAHQQNIIVVLENGLPTGSYFRDCQGTGYTALGFANFSQVVLSIVAENENVLDEKMGLSLFSYYLIVNSTFSVISALTMKNGWDESLLIKDLREFLESLLARGVQDPSCIQYLLESPQLMSKGNFLCSLRGLNENTTENPLAIYNPIPNPLFQGDRV